MRAGVLTVVLVLVTGSWAGCASAPSVEPSRPVRTPFLVRSLVVEQGSPVLIVAKDELDRAILLRGDQDGQRWRRIETSGDDIDGSSFEPSLLGTAADGTEFELAPVIDSREASPTQWILWRRRGLTTIPLATLPDDAR